MKDLLSVAATHSPGDAVIPAREGVAGGRAGNATGRPGARESRTRRAAQKPPAAAAAMRPTVSAPATASAGGRRLARLRRFLLDVPLFYKILLADAGIFFLIGILCVGLVALTLDMVPARPLLLFWSVALGGVVLTVPVRLLILRKALAPIDVLQETAEQVEDGDLSARASQLPLADPNLARLTAVFNRVLDTVATDRVKLQEIAAKAFRAQEAERVRIARELHEDIAQQMAGLLLRLRLVRDMEDADARAEAVAELRDDLVRTADAIREFARGLHPPALQDLGLSAAIEGYARTLPGIADLRIVTDTADTRGLLSPERELALYRIIQEALSNAVRHARATEVRIRIEALPNAVVVSVEDDGVGFHVKAIEAQQPCLGLFGMRERALYGGGSVLIESEPGRGTHVYVRMPAGTEALPTLI
jgi:two-component system, NarL family, sensor histidine kinase UhpB